MVTRSRDGSTWRIGTEAEVGWIATGTSPDRTITGAVPAVFEAYATVLVAYGEERDAHDRAVLTLLASSRPANGGGWGISTPASTTSSSPTRRW